MLDLSLCLVETLNRNGATSKLCFSYSYELVFINTLQNENFGQSY